MNTDSLSASSKDFFRIAEELVMLTKDEVLIITEAMEKSGSSPEQIAQKKGYLDAAQIDIIETLLHPTDTVPGYEIIDVLGQGGMGVVYRARQLNLDRIVALKTILISRMADKSTAGRFAQEAQTIGKLRHPNIIAAYDFGQYEGRLFLSMELVEGEDVEAMLRDRGRLDELSAWSLARQATAGLAHADHLGVVHRDIKPANLLLVEPPEGFSLPEGLQMVKVADFGLAFLADEQQTHTRLTSDNSAVGSPHYMAPEQLTEMDVDFRADIYALGATVYHMLAGRPPFGGLNLSQIIAQKLSGEFRKLSERCPEISAVSCHLVDRMLAREPAERATDYETLLKDIDELIHSLDGSGPASAGVKTEADREMSTGVISTQDTQSMPSADLTTDKSPRPPEQAASRGRRRLWAVGAVVLALGIGTTAWLSQDRAVQIPVLQRVKMQDVGFATPLFVGTSFKGWIRRKGNWVPGKDDEGGFVIKGTSGVAERQLFKQGEGGESIPLEFYRLEISVDPHEATAVEVHFGLLDVSGFDGFRYVVRLDSSGVTLGTRSADLEPFESSGPTSPHLKDFAGPHEVKVEHQPSGWFVTVDGQELSGLAPLAVALPPTDGAHVPRPLPGFRIAAEQGPAWFSDVLIQELTPVTAE